MTDPNAINNTVMMHVISNQWLAQTNPAEVTPIDDLRPHESGTGRCWCSPKDYEGILVHTALDGRTKFETGERKPS